MSTQRTAAPSAAKRARIDTNPGGYGLALPSSAAASHTNGSRAYAPPQSGLALPSQWGASSNVVIDPALQAISPASNAVAGPSKATTPATPQTYAAQAYAQPPAQQPYNPQQQPHYAYQHAGAQSSGTPYYQAQYAQPHMYGQPGQYQQPYARTPHAQPHTPHPAYTPKAAPPPPPATQSHLDSSDVNELNDALGSAGVDIRAEQDAIQRAHELSHPQQNLAMRDDRSKKQAFINSQLIAPTMRTIASKHNLTKVSEDSINYTALALRERLLGIINSSVLARDHRTSSTVSRAPSFYSDDTTPMWNQVVRRDIGKQLVALEKVEREDEARIRRERRERIESGGFETQTANPTPGEGDDNKKKRKRKEPGPGVTAKNMSEETKKKAVDAAAMRAAGGGGTGKYSWMTAGAGAVGAAKKPATPTTTTTATPAATGTPAAKPAIPYTGGGWMRAPMPAQAQAQALATSQAAAEAAAREVTIRDVEFAIEREKGHGGGRGSARGWT